MNETTVPYTLDDYFSTTPIGSIDRAIGNNLYGINHQQIPGAVPSSKDVYGLTFFTRPQLNLQPDNIRNERRFYPLLSDNETSMQRYVRCMLDPRLQRGHGTNKNTTELIYPPIGCPLVDMSQAFIPVLSNNLLTLSGWPDVTAPVFESEAGLYKEAYAQVDGLTKNYASFDLDASFRNTRGDPILYMFYLWLHYSGNVFEGKMVPYMDYLAENVIDYNTRIYRLVLDSEKKKVKKIAASGVAFPISIPTGSFFDFNSETPYSDQNKEITIRFRCLGGEYLDDILIREFNQTTTIFNPAMLDNNRSAYMQLVDQRYLSLFNNRGYPRINENTYDLEWWVDKEVFNSFISGTHPDLLNFFPSATIPSDSNRAAEIDVSQTPEQVAASAIATANDDSIKEYNNTKE